jgi:hypothetical protein
MVVEIEPPTAGSYVTRVEIARVEIAAARAG